MKKGKSRKGHHTDNLSPIQQIKESNIFKLWINKMRLVMIWLLETQLRAGSLQLRQALPRFA